MSGAEVVRGVAEDVPQEEPVERLELQVDARCVAPGSVDGQEVVRSLLRRGGQNGVSMWL